MSSARLRFPLPLCCLCTVEAPPFEYVVNDRCLLVRQLIGQIVVDPIPALVDPAVGVIVLPVDQKQNSALDLCQSTATPTRERRR